MYKMGIFFWGVGLQKLQILFWCIPDIPDILDAGSKPTYEEKMRVPPWDINIPHFQLFFFLLTVKVLIYEFV